MSTRAGKLAWAGAPGHHVFMTTASLSVPTIPLAGGPRIPVIGLGTYGLMGRDGIRSVVSAIDAGYRLLDTAFNYQNEAEVGEAVRLSGVPRDEIFVTTKLPGIMHGYDETLVSFDRSLSNLGLDYVDLYLIHWPNPRRDKYLGSWRAMIELRERGLVRSIGVSNFTEEHMSRLITETDVAPAVNQVELHPHFPQAALRDFHAEHGIVTESWSPLARQRQLLLDDVVTDVADAHGVSATQVVLRWHYQLGAIPIPKSGDAEHQAANLDIFGFELSGEEIASISSLESGRLWHGDPNTHEEF